MTYVETSPRDHKAPCGTMVHTIYGCDWGEEVCIPCGCDNLECKCELPDD